VNGEQLPSTEAVRVVGSFLVRLIAGALFTALVGLALVQDERALTAASASTVLQEDKLKDPKVIAEGAKLFAPSCGNAYCHGTGGAGGGAPRLRGKGLDAANAFKAISNGIPGTAMLSFKSELSEEQIWKLVAFITSDAKASFAAKAEATAGDKPASVSSTAQLKPPDATDTSSIVGNAQAGKALFFDSAGSKSCHSCHSIKGEGASIGPDLSQIGNKSPRELFLSIVLTREIKDSRYATVTLTLRNGDRVVGVKKEEDEESIRVYDTAELPAVLRTVQKADVARLETANESVMPKDYASTYTLKQLLDLVTFLKGAQSRSPITLKDLF
jgi:putative heme-binding domain-containing protein